MKSNWHLISALAVFSISGLIFNSSAGAELPLGTYVVKQGGTPGTDCDFNNISDALGSNRSIFIKNGIYVENLNMGGLSNFGMVGESPNAVIRNSGTDDAISITDCSNILIEKLKIQVFNTGRSAVSFPSGTNSGVMINKCIIENSSGGNAYGISSSVSTTSHISVLDNQLISTGYGNGIDGTFNQSLFEENALTNWGNGFYFIGNYQGNIISLNHIESSGGVGTAGFSLQTCTASNNKGLSQVLDNYISGPETGIEIVWSRDNTISGNKIRGALLYGIYGSDATRSLISNNDIMISTSYSGAGCIYLEGQRSWESAITGNFLKMCATSTNNAYAIYHDANNGCIQGNYAATISGANTVGIYIPPERGSCSIEGNNNRNRDGNALYAPNCNIVEANWNNDTS